MLFTKAVAALLLGALAQTGVTSAAPLDKKDVYVPKVLYPHSGTVWYSGQRHNVTWCVFRCYHMGTLADSRLQRF